MRWIDLVLLLILASFAANGVMQGMLRQLAAMAGFLVMGNLVAAAAQKHDVRFQQVYFVIDP